MIYNFNIKLLAGGSDRISNLWTKNVNGMDACFKIYIPLKGEAILIVEDQEHILKPGNIYFISGWHIQHQKCEDFFETIWIHFVPDSFLLTHILLQYDKIKVISKSNFEWMKFFFDNIQEVFIPYDGTLKKESQIKRNVPDFLVCRLKSAVLAIISSILEEYEYKNVPMKQIIAMQRLQRALDFMDKSFLENPPLSEIAKKVFMAPNYFHKVFKNLFGVTPFEYMLDKRLSIAKELLGFSSMTIKEVAEHAGYNDEFYFSKIFKKYTKQTPTEFKHHIIGVQ